MKHTTKNPFPTSPFEADRLIKAIMEVVNPNKSLMEYAICTAVSQRVPYRQILATIASQISDNVNIGREIFGEKLVSEIMDFN